jgi:hypothetical protein
MARGPNRNSRNGTATAGTVAAQEVSLFPDNGVASAPAQTAREALFHALAVAHLQRVRVIELLTEIDRKLSILVDVAFRNEGKTLQ